MEARASSPVRGTEKHTWCRVMETTNTAPCRRTSTYEGGRACESCAHGAYTPTANTCRGTCTPRQQKRKRVRRYEPRTVLLVAAAAPLHCFAGQRPAASFVSAIVTLQFPWPAFVRRCCGGVNFRVHREHKLKSLLSLGKAGRYRSLGVLGQLYRRPRALSRWSLSISRVVSTRGMVVSGISENSEFK